MIRRGGRRRKGARICICASNIVEAGINDIVEVCKDPKNYEESE